MEKHYKENCIERFERENTAIRIAGFNAKMKLPYEQKIAHAKQRAYEFVTECENRGLDYHVSVGGLDSITLLCFLRSIGITCPAISVSTLEDASIQKIHRQLGVIGLHPSKRPDGTYWTKQKVLQELGFPVLSKEKAAKIEHLQNPTARNATVRHAIITGETGEYGGFRKESRMKLPQKWLEKFGGADAEGAALGYQASPFKVSAKCCQVLKEKPCDDWAKEHNSVPFLGLMASEGGRREKALKMHGCNYFGKSAIRSCPFAIFSHSDVLRLAVELNVPVPEIYGEIRVDENGEYYTTGASRTGCAMCGFGCHLDNAKHFRDLKKSNPRAYDYWMHKVCKDENGNPYGWADVFDYCGIKYEDDQQKLF